MLAMTRINAQIDFSTIVWLRILQVIGIPFIFIPISLLAYVGIAPSENNQISGITNFVRNIGGAVGLSVLMTYMERHRQASRTALISHLSNGSVFYRHYFAMLSHGGQNPAATHRALAELQAMVDRQASACLHQHFLLGRYRGRLPHAAALSHEAPEQGRSGKLRGDALERWRNQREMKRGRSP